MARLDEHAGFPPSAVVVRFAHRDGGPAPRWGPRDSRFPLTLDRFKPRVWRPWRWLWFQAAGIEYEAWVWIGARASRADVEAVRGVIRSFRPEPLRSRTTSGCRFYVLDYLRSYRVGSVRRYDPHQLPKAECLWHRPFYLVRGRQGPYTISWDSTMPGGYKHCSVRYSVRRSQFFCPNGARWDRRGRVVHNPDPAQYKNDPLDMRDAVVAYDGHVLASPS